MMKKIQNIVILCGIMSMLGGACYASPIQCAILRPGNCLEYHKDAVACVQHFQLVGGITPGCSKNPPVHVTHKAPCEAAGGKWNEQDGYCSCQMVPNATCTFVNDGCFANGEACISAIPDQKEDSTQKQ